MQLLFCMSKVICVWLRNDLRVHDSPVLHQAALRAKQHHGLQVLPVYIFDPRHFQRTRYGTLKTGPTRALFLLQSVLSLKRQLRNLGSDLVVKVGHPEEILPALLAAGSSVLTQEEVTSEELGLDCRVRSALGEDVRWEYCWGTTLFHREDLPFRRDLSDMPDVYTRFKNMVEPELACKANEVPPTFKNSPKPKSEMKVRPCLPVPEAGSLPLPQLPEDWVSFEPAWGDLPYAEAVSLPTPHPGAVLNFQGGEEAALDRLNYYIRDARLIATYFDTRNEMLGGDYSTKFAPWLAHGCLSPRKVFEQLREHEKAFAASKSTYWILFALGARDFYRFFAAKHGDAVFREGGVTRRKQTWRGGDREFDLWAQGQTGFPFIDANMRELLATGFMSNRGRQNVASFLILDLGVDWRRGADWFESHLVDYDVTANWCNWVAAAGLTGGRLNRFNVLRQSKNYDPSGAYIRHWVPELANVPASFVHEPWRLSDQDRDTFGAQSYPSPCIDPSPIPNSPGPVPVQLKGLKGRGKGAQSSPKGRRSRPEHAKDDNVLADGGQETQPQQKSNSQTTGGHAAPAQVGSVPRRWKSSREQQKAEKPSSLEEFEGPSWLTSEA
mmetsp:Transcript_85871/g.152052  ORF Transcript_85871/g.152052 Transcript_85871/m.152052 type:complete len:610 (-) Transcript_85871:81-1910(-)